MRKPFLMTPGPSNVPPRVLEALGRPIVHHRAPEFDPIFSQCLEGLRYVFQTKNPVVTFAGSGTAAMEAAIAGTLSPGDRIITLEAGKFGQRWGQIARAYGMDVITIEAPWGRSVPPEELEMVLGKNRGVKAVYATLCETSTASLGDVRAYGEVVRGSDAILAVDAISGLAADRLETDAWGVDIAVAGSQKALMLPPGLAFATVSEKAKALIETAKCPCYYLSMKKALKNLADNTTAYTPAISLIVGLNEALTMIREEGIENVWARHAKLADALRAGGEGLGLRIFSKAPSNTAVAYEVPEGTTYKAISGHLRDEFAITIAGGQDQLKGKILRFAAMGWADEKDVILALGALEMTLAAVGVSVPEPGAGAAAAMASMSGRGAVARVG